MNAMLPMDLTSIAEFSPCRTWRYTLNRQWADGPAVAFLMFNPSTADERRDDNTIRRCRGFAERWGYGRMVILNLFAIRGTDPRIVRSAVDPYGPNNDYWIRRSTAGVREVICAWGCSQHMKGDLALRPQAAIYHIRDEHGVNLPINCLGFSADGSPRHPLMLPYAAERVHYPRRSTP